MKIFLRHKETFYPETVDFYEQNFEITNDMLDADVVVINDFNPIIVDKIVACNATGLDHIKAKEVISLRGMDLRELTAVPELCLGMAIYCTRIFKGEEVKGKTLGLIGYGRIGKQFGNYAHELGMKVEFYDNYNDGEYENNRQALKYVLENSDIVSLHITAEEHNRHFMDKGKFEMMKDGAIFLNSARPWLVNQEDLYWALEHKLAGSWVDFNLPFAENLVTTPHLGGATKESKQKSELMIAKKLKQLYGN